MASPPKWNGVLARDDLESAMDRLAHLRVDTLRFLKLRKTDPLHYAAVMSGMLEEIGYALVDLQNALDKMDGDKVPSLKDFLAELNDVE